MAEAYTPAQIAALIAMLQDLRVRLPALAQIAGHEDLDLDEVEASDDPVLRVRRKRDPGPQFPWPQVLAQVPLQRIWVRASA
jgi:N-acetylmuramoyl-L-alanine amidase